MGHLLYKSHRPACKTHPEWCYDAVIYELNIRQFSAEGNFQGVSAQLERLRDLGVDLIWLMPVFPIGQERRKGTMGSYYSVRDYYSVNPEFGTKQEFQQLVDRIHELGMRVIMDWIPNHTSRDAVWTKEHPEWYQWDDKKGEIMTPFDWSDTAQLDYDKPELRRAMTEAMRYWITDFGIDGFRVDMAMLVPMDFWDQVVPELQQSMPDGQTIFMLAESEGPGFHKIAFDATYSWELHHLMVDLAQGRVSAQSMRDRLSYESSIYPQDALRLRFTSNHDENTWNGSEFFRFGNSVMQMAALTFLLPGIPLIYNGQEAASDRVLEFFEKDEVDWTGLGGNTEAFYKELIDLRHSHPALRSGEQGGDVYSIDNSLDHKVFAFKREVDDRIVMGLFNFSDDHADMEFFDEDFRGEYKQVGSSEMAKLQYGSHFYLPPWGFFIYYR